MNSYPKEEPRISKANAFKSILNESSQKQVEASDDDDKTLRLEKNKEAAKRSRAKSKTAKLEMKAVIDEQDKKLKELRQENYELKDKLNKVIITLTDVLQKKMAAESGEKLGILSNNSLDSIIQQTYRHK